MMKRLVVLLALAALVVVAGCATKLNKKSMVMINPITNKVLLDKNDNPVLGTLEYSDEDSHNRAQVDLAHSRHPVAELGFPAGGEMPKGAVFTVWGRNGAEVALKQRVPESVQVINAVGNNLAKVAPSVVVGVAVDRMAEAKSGNTYKGSFNDNQGNLSGTGRVTGGVSTAITSGEGNTGSSSADPEDTSTSTSSNGGNSILPFGSN